MRLNPQADTDAAAARGFEKTATPRVTLKELVQPGTKETMRQALAEPPAFARGPARPIPPGTKPGGATAKAAKDMQRKVWQWREQQGLSKEQIVAALKQTYGIRERGKAREIVDMAFKAYGVE